MAITNNVSDVQKLADIIVSDYFKPVWPYQTSYLFDTRSTILPPGFTNSSLSQAFNRNYQYALIITHGGEDNWQCQDLIHNFDCNYAKGLENSAGLHCFTAACLTAAYDKVKCLGTDMVLNNHGGALTYVGSSREGWSSGTYGELSLTPLLMAEIMKSVFENKTVLKTTSSAIAVNLAKKKFAPLCDYENLWRWMYYSVNTIGDPLVKTFTKTPTTVDASLTYTDRTITITVPDNMTEDFRVIYNYVKDGKRTMKVYVNKHEVSLRLRDGMIVSVESKNYLPKIWKYNKGLLKEASSDFQ